MEGGWWRNNPMTDYRGRGRYESVSLSRAPEKNSRYRWNVGSNTVERSEGEIDERRVFKNEVE